MSRMYIRKASWEEDEIKEKSVVTTQGRKEMEVRTLLLGNDRNSVIADEVLSYF